MRPGSPTRSPRGSHPRCGVRLPCVRVGHDHAENTRPRAQANFVDRSQDENRTLTPLRGRVRRKSCARAGHPHAGPCMQVAEGWDRLAPTELLSRCGRSVRPTDPEVPPARPLPRVEIYANGACKRNPDGPPAAGASSCPAGAIARNCTAGHRVARDPLRPTLLGSRPGCGRCSDSHAWRLRTPSPPGMPSCKTCAAATPRSPPTCRSRAESASHSTTSRHPSDRDASPAPGASTFRLQQRNRPPANPSWGEIVTTPDFVIEVIIERARALTRSCLTFAEAGWSSGAGACQSLGMVIPRRPSRATSSAAT
jgi:hypothetical protein